jgi:hypothetical protein
VNYKEHNNRAFSLVSYTVNCTEPSPLSELQWNLPLFELQ